MTTRLYLMKEFAEYLKANPAEAREFFKQAGILDEDGKLTPPYNETRIYKQEIEEEFIFNKCEFLDKLDVENYGS